MIDGIDELLARINKLEHISMLRPVGKAISFVQEQAKAGCLSASGELRESIFVAIKQQETNVTGTCYSNKKYAPYVELGTGPKGQEQHESISPNITVSYSQSPWWIHESQIDKELAEKYHWFFIDTEDGRFYQCTGQPARPFMYPALKDHEDDVTEIIYNDIREQLK